MKLTLRLTIFTLLTALLSACIEVEEDNSDIAAALERQNQIIEDRHQSTAASVTLFGTVADAASKLPVEASVRLRQGLNWQDPVTTVDGAFEIKNVIPRSDYLLEVSSPSDSFVTRVKFDSARSNPSGVVFHDIGTIEVSEGITRSFSILDEQTMAPVEGLVLKGYSHIGTGSGVEKYAHVSTYNSATNTYDIVLPEFISLTLNANLDIDLDKKIDFVPSNATFKANDALQIRPRYFDLNENILLNNTESLEEYQQIELRVSVVDEDTNFISAPTLSVEDSVNGRLEFEFDEATSQYVLNAKIGQYLLVMIPAFKDSDRNYRSASINISKSSQDQQLGVSFSGSANNSSYRVPADMPSLDIVIEPRRTSESTILELVLKSESLGANNSVRFFYSNAASLPSGSAKLIQERQLKVTRGNESDTDLIPAGTTVIEEEEIELGLASEFTLGDTLLTLSPVLPLPGASQFRYEVNQITDQFSGRSADLRDDLFRFSVPSSEEFSITSLVLDNNNHTLAGAPINAVNTAGEEANPVRRSNSTYIYAPLAIENLESLTLVKRIVTERSRVETRNQNLKLITAGNIRFGGSSLVVSTANNENIEAALSVQTGTSLEDGRYYRFSINEFMADHSGDEPSTVAFDYLLERKNGDVETGSLVLEVQ